MSDYYDSEEIEELKTHKEVHHNKGKIVIKRKPGRPVNENSKRQKLIKEMEKVKEQGATLNLAPGTKEPGGGRCGSNQRYITQ